ncbi:AsmA family protein [Falsiroseomonas sp.]|uniref:AsmA family protein n=1 Tax=Falsiroseomonas sp. TaxID=2870721 RepID=UPI0035618F07
MSRWLRLALIGAAGIALLSGGAVVALQVALARGALTAQVDAALERAIGRSVTHGAVSVRPGLKPRIAMADATIANIAGGSAPDFARIGRLEVTLALLPLLAGRVEIGSLLLADSEILLERDAAGRANWSFRDGGAGSSSGGLGIGGLEIVSSRILLPGAPIERIEIDSLTFARDDPHDPIELAGRIRLNGEALTVSASVGEEAAGALPLTGTATGEGLRFTLRGTWPRRMEAPGWSLALDAQTEPGTVQRLARAVGRPDLPLAPGPIGLKARLGPGSPMPAVSDLTLKLGATDLGAAVPGLRLTRAELRAASLEDAVTVSAKGRRAGAELALVLTLPSLRSLLEATEEETWPVEATVTSGPSRLTLSAAVRRNLDLGATAFDARLTTPDLSRLGPLFGTTLPRLTGVTARARLSGLGTSQLRLASLSTTANVVEAEGELAIAFAPRTAFRGRLAMRRLDLDAIAGARSTAPGRRAQRLIPQVSLPVEALRAADASLALSAATMTAGGTRWRDASATLTLENGRLVLDRLVVTSPGGVLGGRLSLDAAARLPQAVLQLDSRGRGLDLAALRRAFGTPAALDGDAELSLDLRAQGASLPALAATLRGEAGIAMVGGRFTGATALSIGPDLSRILLPRGSPAGGVGLRCLALRLSAEDGIAQSQVLLAEGDFGRIDGSLAVNLGNETVAARLLADVSLMGVTVRTPVTIGGTLMAPRVGVEPGPALAQVVGDAVANRLWRNSTVEFLRGVTGSIPPGGDCGVALTAARLGRAGRMPEAAATPIPLVPREVQGVAQGLVRGVGGLLGGRRP